MYWTKFLAQMNELGKNPAWSAWTPLFELTLGYLKKEVDETSFLQAVRLTIKAAEKNQQVLEILDNWLTGLFYYQESSFCWFKRKRMRRMAYLSWTECIYRISRVTGTPEIQAPFSMEARFDELHLMGCNYRAASSSVANQTIAFVREFPKLTRLRVVVAEEGSRLFRQRYYPIGWLHRVTLGGCAIMSVALVSACLVMLYKVLVQYPLFRLLADVHSSKSTVQLVEVAVQGVAFVRHGYSVFSSRILVWCLLMLFTLVIDQLGQWVSRSWLK